MDATLRALGGHFVQCTRSILDDRVGERKWSIANTSSSAADLQQIPRPEGFESWINTFLYFVVSVDDYPPLSKGVWKGAAQHTEGSLEFDRHRHRPIAASVADAPTSTRGIGQRRICDHRRVEP
jgi:hypothetical protein